MAIFIILAVIFGLFWFYIMWSTGNMLSGIAGLFFYLVGFSLLEFRMRMKRRKIRSLQAKNKRLRAQTNNSKTKTKKLPKTRNKTNSHFTPKSTQTRSKRK